MSSFQSRYQSLKATFDHAGQGHVFAFWDDLSDSAKASLLDQLERIDIERVNHIFTKSIEAEEAAKHSSCDDVEPLPDDAFDSIVNAPQKEVEWRSVGLRAIAEGKTAVLLMAGGQGTRLGSSDPKGCYNIGLPSNKSLFQVQAERIKRLQAVAEEEFQKKPGSVIIRWYIMTSQPTHDATRSFFGWDKEGKPRPGQVVNFGLTPDQVVFFKQGIYIIRH